MNNKHTMLLRHNTSKMMLLINSYEEHKNQVKLAAIAFQIIAFQV